LGSGNESGSSLWTGKWPLCSPSATAGVKIEGSPSEPLHHFAGGPLCWGNLCITIIFENPTTASARKTLNLCWGTPFELGDPSGGPLKGGGPPRPGGPWGGAPQAGGPRRAGGGGLRAGGPLSWGTPKSWGIPQSWGTPQLSVTGHVETEI